MRRTLLVLLAVLATASVVAGAGAPATSQLRVGYVVGAGAIPDRTNLFGLPYDGFIRAVGALGVQGRVLQVAPNQDATGPLSLLARQRYDLVIVGLPATKATVAVAGGFPGRSSSCPTRRGKNSSTRRRTSRARCSATRRRATSPATWPL